MTIANNKGIMQILPALETGGTERVAISLAIAAKKAGYASFVVSNGGSLVRELARENIVHIELPVHDKNIFTLKLRAKALEKIIFQNQIALVHAHSRVPAWLGFKATRNNDTIFMATCHGFFNTSNFFRKRYSEIIGKGSCAVAVSKFIHNYLRDTLNTSEKNIRTIPLGVNLEHYHAETVSALRMITLLEKWNIPEDQPIIMLPGRISRTKGQDVLIKAIAAGRKDIRY